MLNRIVLMGRLVKDPELRYTATQKAVTTFTIACERDYAPSGGNKTTDFIDCVAWRSAEFISKYFTKGSMIVLEGRLELRSWTDKDGNNRRTTEINVENVYFGGSKKDDASVPTKNSGAYEDMYVDGQFNDIPDDEGELPF